MNGLINQCIDECAITTILWCLLNELMNISYMWRKVGGFAKQVAFNLGIVDH